ncbi:MAG TPA: arginase family protein [Streptosporangiaceae bacterium]|jgi:arginase
MTIGLVSAPSNLGLRPPAPSSVPGCAKAPEALREAGLHHRLAQRGAVERGVVLPGRYSDDPKPGSLRNQAAIIDHTRRLAARIDHLREEGLAPLVLGGDCGILMAAGLALSRAPGRYALVHLDGHTDFRNPGTSDRCASLAGEDLAAAVGRHWPAIAAIDGHGPYFDPADTVHAGCRDDDAALEETRALLAAVIPAAQIRHHGPEQTARRILEVVDRPGLDGYWLHLDVDILDPAVMPAVDSPDPGGLSPSDLTTLLTALAPRATGAQVTVFDPDLDPEAHHARLLTEILTPALTPLGQARM